MQRKFTASRALGQRRLSDAVGLMPLGPALGAAALDEQAECREVAYDLDGVDGTFPDRRGLNSSLEGWAELLPPLVIGGGLGEGGTPTFEITLPGVKGGSLIIKDESRNPTGTHKDRLARCIASGVAWAGGQGLVVASSGNHALAAAAYSAAAGLECVAVLARGAPAPLHAALELYGAEVIEVHRDDRWAITRKVVQTPGFASATNLHADFHVGHPFGSEGYKTIAYELVAELGLPGVVACPIGYGELVFGLVKGFAEMEQVGVTDGMPLIVGCETAARPALTAALQSRHWPPKAIEAAPTVARSIGTTVPGNRAWREAVAGRCQVVTVSEHDILAAQRRLARKGVYVETSSAAALAGIDHASNNQPEAFRAGPVVMVATSSGFRESLLAG
ncbi:MAG: threonine synthase [Nocardioides sp.]